MEMKHRPHIPLADLLLVIGGTEERKHHTVCAERRLNHIWYVFFLLLIVKVGHILTRCILMLCEIIICSVGNSPELAPSNRREQKFDICRPF